MIAAALTGPAGREIPRPSLGRRHLAATGLRVQSPEEGLADLAPGSRILMMNPNYLDEIRIPCGQTFEYQGV